MMSTKRMTGFKQILAVCLVLVCTSLGSFTVSAQDLTITGTVTNGKNEKVEGAKITVQGKTVTNTTDVIGRFTILAAPNDTIVVSHSEYLEKKVAVKEGDEDIKIKLKEKPQEKELSLFELAKEGGFLMIVLLVLSIIAIYIFGSKWWLIHKAGKVDKNFIRNIRILIHEGKTKAALELCRKYDNPTARLVEKGIERIGRPLEDIQAAVENMGNVEVARLEKGLPMLATIAGGAPMIGFLGTVIGMIIAFFEMSNAGNNIDITLLSGGIYTAMVTTVAGLMVGIIAYFGYNYLTSQISNLVFKMESATIAFIDMLHEPAENKDDENTILGN